MFLSAMILAVATRYEAENAVISPGIVETLHSGFSGTGYANADNVAGSYVEIGRAHV